MTRLYEKFAILLLCLPGFLIAGSVAVPVLTLLLAIVISCAVQLLSGRRLAWVILFTASAVCGIVPVLACALPLFLYDALREKHWWLVLPGISVLGNTASLSVPQLLCIVTGVLATLILQKRLEKLEGSVGRLTDLHDSIADKNLQLAEQNKRLFEAQDSEIHLATLRERNRIAREIHDNVGHMLTRSILQTGALQILNHDPSIAEPLNELKATLDGAMTSIRSSVHDLHDDSIDLKRVIEEMIEGVRSDAGIQSDGEGGGAGSLSEEGAAGDAKTGISPGFDVSFQYDASAHIPGHIKLCVAGIVKEGISNAVRHSNGDKIDIIFREHPGFYQLLLEDNGTNDEKKEASGGIGLRNMEDRAKSVGGRITFTPSPKSFRIFLTIPKQG